MKPLVLSHKIHSVKMLLPFLLLIATIGFAQTSKQDEVRELLPNQTVEREMSAGKTHRYKIALKKDEFLQIRVEQKGIDVVLKLFDARGKVLTKMDSPNGIEGSEVLSFIADDKGIYTVEVKSLEAEPTKGNYIISLEISRAASEKDRKMLLAEATFVEAFIFQAEDSRKSRQESLPKFEQAKQLLKELGDNYREGLILYSLGLEYSYLGEKQKALENYNEALTLFRTISDKRQAANTLIFIGKIYKQLGERQKALEYYNQALMISRASGYKEVEFHALINLGALYGNLPINPTKIKRNPNIDELQKALNYFNQALSFYRKIDRKDMEANVLNNLGAIYFQLGEKQEAFELLKQSALLNKIIGNRQGEASALLDIGIIYNQSGSRQKALEYYNQILPLIKIAGNKNFEADMLGYLSDFWQSSNNPRLAIFYGKQSVNKYQELRQSITGLNQEIQKTHLESVESTYRKLAEILVAEGRLFEAQQILAMLKEDEYFDYVRRDPDEIKKLSLRADLRADERAALEKYEALAGKVTEYGAQFAKLEELKNKQGADFRQQTEYDDLKAKLDAANAAFRIFLEKELAAELGKPAKREIEIDRTLQTKLQQWGGGTVALYTVAGDERYRVILTTPKTQTDGKTEIKIADLNKKIFEFRAALQNPSVDPRPLGKELYDILIKPIEKDLIAAEAKTLLWSLDGTLRYIPFAALSPDGKTYLAEKYQNVVITSTTRQSLLAETDPNWHLLGAGVTKASRLTEPNGTEEITFSALPGVQNELLKIVSDEEAKSRETGLLTGRRLIDEGFNLAALENGMSQRAQEQKPKYNVIHLATHFRLGGDTAKSFLLLGGNQALTLEKVSDNTALNFGDVELVTLSACNTGFGTAIESKTASREQERRILEQNNGSEVDSLATFIELRGAKAVLASLWSVADESTSLLMSEFYRLRKDNPNITKAEAMRQAQLLMIQGKLKPSANSPVCRSEVVNLEGAKQPLFKCDANAPYSHPYF